MSQIVKAIIFENSSVTLLARVRDSRGDYIGQGDITSLTCKVFDLDGETPSSVSATPMLDKADVVFDTLQTDTRWTVDATGYNFAAGLAGSNFPTGDHAYQVEIMVTPAEGDSFYIVYELQAANIFSE